MKYTLLILVLTISSCYSQVNTVIGDYEKEVNWSGDGGPRPFIGTFNFETIPEPLKPTRVDFTLEVNSDIYVNQDDKWEVILNYPHKGVQLLCDTVFTWAGPHIIGDQYTGYFEFVPLCSGNWRFLLHLNGVSMISALDFAFKLNQDGNIVALGKTKDVRGYEIPICTFFNNNDSVFIGQQGHVSDELFEYNYVVKPIFNVGDTSVIIYYLTALENAPNGVDIEINVDNMDVITLPKKISKPVLKGDTLILNLQVVPRAIKDEHRIIIILKNNKHTDNDYKQSIITCGSVFNDDGTARFIRDDLGTTIKHELLPNVYPVGNPGNDEAIIIPKEVNREVIRKEHYKIRNEN
ncbi:MAG: hypothetical protein ACOYVF_03475 [Candidatus Zixiibacteriota bacterium]